MDKLLLLCASYLMSREVHFLSAPPTGWILKATGDSWELRPLKAVCGCLSHEPTISDKSVDTFHLKGAL